MPTEVPRLEEVLGVTIYFVALNVIWLANCFFFFFLLINIFGLSWHLVPLWPWQTVPVLILSTIYLLTSPSFGLRSPSPVSSLWDCIRSLRLSSSSYRALSAITFSSMCSRLLFPHDRNLRNFQVTCDVCFFSFS